MTSIAAVKKGKKICIACDALTTYGRRKEIEGQNVCKDPKILPLGSGYIGVSGTAAMSSTLKNYIENRSFKSPETLNGVFHFFLDFRRNMFHSYFSSQEDTSNWPFHDSGALFLIVNNGGIFEINHDGTLRHFCKFAAIGSGENYALGAIASVYERGDDAREMACLGIRVAASFDRKTMLPLSSFCVDL